MRVIAGAAHGRRIAAPRGLATRPATARVRASIFSRLAARFDLTGARVLDLFAGSGSLGLEALSRGAQSAVFVDSARAAAIVIRRNLDAIGFTDRARVLVLELQRALARLAAERARFDLVFIDAPYARDTSAGVIAALVELRLVAARGWVVVRQDTRASALAPPRLELINQATVGDHRIALYRWPLAPPN